MDVFNFCWMTLLNESKKSSVFFDKNTCNVKNDIDENFNKPVNRIAYLYKFGAYNISFFHQCFKEFLTKAPDSSKIVDNFLSLKNLNICSMSAGPGTDIIGLLYSLHLVNKPLVNSTTFKIISRHGAWRNLVTEMMSSSIISVPEASTCKLIENDFLKELSKKSEGYLKAADILLMCNSLSPSVPTAKVTSNTLQRIIKLLKPGTLVFFIDSKEKSTYFKKIGSFGTFLYGPVEATLENMPYNEQIAELVGVKPLCSGRSLFAVWQKIHEVNSEVNLRKVIENSLTADSNQHSPVKLINSASGVKNINSPIVSMSNLKKEFSSGTNFSSSDSIASSSQFSSGSTSGEIIKREKQPVLSDNSAKNVLNASNSLVRKYPSCRNSPQIKENNGDDMNSLLKNFENLISKFEGLMGSHNSLKSCQDKEKQPSGGQQCHQSMHQGHCKCSVKPGEFKRNGSTCCHSITCHTDTNVHDHYCSTSAASNLYGNLPQIGPCIVIPLQNLSNESLTQILSIVSQNCSSVNETTLLPKEENS